jgi:SagB-type dehydrogenase family enzyme
MSNLEIQFCSDYAQAIFQRARKAMEPRDFSPNWPDQPSRYKIYGQVERFPLPIKVPTRLASMADILSRINTPRLDARGLTFEEISLLLLLAHGVLGRRLGINWNPDNRDRTRYYQATYNRGSASGGGMYPTEIYWVCGQSGPLLSGLYHYDNAHHAVERLYTGDLTRRVQVAVSEHPAAASTDQFLLISLNFWKNSFKYNTFSYHVVTQDLGALLSSLRFVATGLGSDLQFLFWFRDEELNRLLGLDTLAESVFVVVPIPTTAGASSISPSPYQAPLTASNEASTFPRLDAPLVNKAYFQRSKTIIRFPLIESVHQSALIEEEPRPDISKAFQASCDEFDTNGERVELPPPALELLQSDVLEVFKKRRSSFGRFSNHHPLCLSELATALYFGATARNYTTDLKQADGTPHFTRLMVFVNNVAGLERGAYAYDRGQHCLWTVCKADLASFLQYHYFLQNYNLVETGAVIAVVGKVDRMLEVYGNRGYRILNAEVGLVAQGIYMASTALSFGCGAVLGFDNMALNEVLGLDGSDERTILILLTGHERTGSADFDYRLI